MSAAMLLVSALFIHTYTFAVEGGIPQVDNLAEVASLSTLQRVPTIVFVSRDACPYCRTLRDNILLPMYAANKFENRGNLVEISLDRLDPLTGFDGKSMSAREFGELYKAGITPTLLFLDADGHEISQRRIGISNLDLYGFYLQKSIDEALTVTR